MVALIVEEMGKWWSNTRGWFGGFLGEREKGKGMGLTGI